MMLSFIPNETYFLNLLKILHFPSVTTFVQKINRKIQFQNHHRIEKSKSTFIYNLLTQTSYDTTTPTTIKKKKKKKIIMKLTSKIPCTIKGQIFQIL